MRGCRAGTQSKLFEMHDIVTSLLLNVGIKQSSSCFPDLLATLPVVTGYEAATNCWMK